MHRHMAAGLILVVGVALGACTEKRSGDSTALVRDSAGIQIVENTAPQWKEGADWILSSEPPLDIGTVDGPPQYQFSRIIAALRLPSGDIAVANGGTQEIRYYDAAGKHLRTIGGAGGGPGEFQFLSWIRGLPGDSLLAYDMRQRRLSTFDSTGALVGSETLTFDGQKGSPRPVERFPDGTLLIQTGSAFSAGELKSGARRDSVIYLHSSADGTTLNEVTGLRGSEGFIKTDGQSITVAKLPFGRSSSYSLAGEHIFAADNDVYEIRVYSPNGDLERLIRRSGKARPVAQADIDEVKRKRIDEIDNPAFRKEMEGILAEMPIPATMPAFAEFRTDSADDLWVKEYPGADADAPSTWTVFDPEGQMLGQLSMPARFQVMQIGDDFVLGVWKDDLDVEHVRMYALQKRS